MLRRRMFLAAFSAGLILAFLLVFRLRVVVVNGSLHTKPQDVTAILLERPGAENTILIKLLNTNRKLEREGFIDSLNAVIQGRDKLRVIVKERQFVGCIEYGGMYWYFDSAGYAKARAAARTAGEPIPPVEGLTLRGEPQIMEALPALNTKAFSMLAMLRGAVDADPALLPDRVSFDGSAMTLYYGEITVLMGNGEKMELRLKQLRQLMPELSSGYRGTLHMENYDGSQKGILFDKLE